uniref:Cytochrome c oxidase subunit 3 n=1 Tax=Leipothrix sp. 1 XFX-2017 TaxID=1955440 RepID=A0A1S5XVY5_9ACAR|nr:cytochrome oxidase subunit 3 [Leipothrix sp. 1 XFX-2017]
MMTKSHNFFLDNPNPYPLLISSNSFVFFISLLIFMKYGDWGILMFSISSVSLIALFWWANFSGEFNLEGKDSFNMEKGVKNGMIFFISSEVFFFFTFFWSYFHYNLSPSMEISMEWPPVMVSMFDFSNVPFLNTLILLTSGLTVTISHFYLTCSQTRKAKIFLSVTVGLGLLFTYFQLVEYSSGLFTISDSSFGSIFFILTGFHGLHVLIGTLFLLAILWRFFKNCAGNLESLSFEICSWYWHFVDVVWIFLFYTLYYINA